MASLFIEAITVGFMVLIGGTILIHFLSYLFSVSYNNKHYVIEISLFLTGFLIHIICEFTGINKWYCKYGNACKKN